MKGFPAWPAMITEPEQWDLPAAKKKFIVAKKKLLVYFYGTKEIALCNYADIEAFTEEKKKSLLVKRHGKGADFVRAVKEIVEIYDSLKEDKKDINNDNNNSGFTENNLKIDVENHANDCGSLDTEGPDDGSDPGNDKKMEGCPSSCMDHSMVGTPRSVNTMEGEHCVVDSADGNPIEKSSILHESNHSPWHASSCSKKRQKDSQKQNSCTHGNFASSSRSRSSLGADLRTSRDSGVLMDGTHLPSVDLSPGDKQEDSAHRKCIEDDKPSPCSVSGTKEAVLSHPSRGTCSQLAVSGASNDDEGPCTVIDSVQCPFSNELSKTGVRDKEVKLNGTVDLPMTTTRTFKRKRRANNCRANNPASIELKNMDRALQPKSNGDLVYSPNLRNEINRSDGDEHLPLVKRARVRMERSPLENPMIDKPGHSSDKTEPAKLDPCIKQISGKDQSADDVPPAIDASPKTNYSDLPGEVQNSCMNNSEERPMVMTLDVEAALPPSKRLHRLLEAMSVNASETVSALPEVTKSKEVTLEGCTASTERSPPKDSADALVESPKSAMAKSPKVSLTVLSLDAPTGRKHITEAVMLNKDALPPVSLDLRTDVSDSVPKDKVSEETCIDSENLRTDVSDSVPKDKVSEETCIYSENLRTDASDSVPKAKVSEETCIDSENLRTDVSDSVPKDKVSEETCIYSENLRTDVIDSVPKDKVSEETCIDSENVPDLAVHTGIDSNDYVKDTTCSMKLEEPGSASKFDRLPLCNASGNKPMESIKGSTNGFGKTIDVPISRANATVLYTSGSCDPMPHVGTVLDKSLASVCDRTSASSLVSKVPCIHSDTSTRAFEMHSSSVIAPEDLDHRINLKDKSLSSVPTEGLVADGHAHIFSQSNSFIDSSLDSKFASGPLVNIPSLKEGSSSWCSPSKHSIKSASDRVHTEQDSGEIPFDNLQPEGLLAGCNEAHSSRRAFEACVGTLTRTKESISRATRLALDCAKHGIAGEVMDIIIEHLEKESYLYKRVDLFFLVDSIIRYCRNQKGGPGGAYPSLIQAVLPRIIYASAPPGNSAWENRRQCLKVLRLWLERKTLSEYIIRHHIKELEALNDASFGSSHRPSGTERALNDPLRDDEAFFVDEYGSNDGLDLQNLICTKLLEVLDGRSSEERSFEGLTPEHEVTDANEQEACQLHVTKHQLLLEEVDGELEMEDAAPSSGPEASTGCQEHLTNNGTSIGTAQHLSSVPPLPDDKAPSPPPLPSSPPPLPRPSCLVSQDSQVQGALPVAADCVEQHHPGANYNVEGQHPYSAANNRGNMNACIASSQPPIPYNPGYSGHTNQIYQPPPPPPPQPIATFPSGPHGSLCGPSLPHHGNNYHHPPPAPLPNSGYHLQPPPHPPGPNQFPCPPEPEQRGQPWNCGPPAPSYPERYQYGGHDRGHHGYDRGPYFDDRGHQFDDRGHRFDGGMPHFDDRWRHFHDRGQMHHEVMDGGRFPSFFPPGPPCPDHFEAPPNQFHCGRPLDPPAGPCSGWPMPHRRSKYPPDSRHSMEPPVSNGGGWRRHGRRDYDRYH